MACETIFIRQLHQRGLRLTPQREMVLSALHEAKGFETAEEIYERVRRLSSSVDISTVYRTLDLLHQMGFVSSVEMGDGQVRFALTALQEPHIHLVCQRCGRIVGVPQEEVEPFLHALRTRYGFEMKADDVTLYGLCEACRRAAPDA